MFFDCTGLMAGLVATVITKVYILSSVNESIFLKCGHQSKYFAQWRANPNYSYGYVRAETLAGFINGLFLLFISFFIFSEVTAHCSTIKGPAASYFLRLLSD